MKLKYILFLATLFIFSSCTSPVYGQYEAFVKKASIETADGIRFSGWINNHAIKQNQDTIINFLIENHSSRTIYLAWRVDKPITDIDCDLRLHIYPAQPTREVGHDQTEFKFIKISKGSSYKNALTVPITVYAKSDTYWIDVSFGYVIDISGLKRQPNEDPARFNGLFNSRINYVGLGGLIVKVEK